MHEHMAEMATDKFFVAAALREIGTRLQLEGTNPFRAKAYDRAADSVEASTNLEVLVAEERLTELAGIGEGTARIISELVRAGQSKMLEELRKKIPAGVVELSQLPGVGLKRAILLHEALGVESVVDLERACAEGKVKGVRGLGAKTEKAILRGIQDYKGRATKILLLEGMELAHQIVHHLEGVSGAEKVEVAGAVRRFEETLSEVSVVATTKDPQRLLAAFEKFPLVARVEMSGPRDMTVRLSTGVKASVHTASVSERPLALAAFTGSSAHIKKLRAIAARRGLSLDDRALEEDGRALAVSSEEDLYAHLGLSYVPPELREDVGELEEAGFQGQSGKPFDLLELPDVQGLVHCHTVFSDGKDTVEAMARKAEALGMKYMTITDHSPAAHYAGGVTLDRLKEQWDEIARVQELVPGVRLLRGTESDILADGSLDYPDAILEKMDVVIASVHSRMKMDEEAMTARITRAMRQPVFKIWGHALGRLLLRREPFACRVEHVLDAIAESRAAIEVNGDPYRLDMEPRWIREARKRGIPFVVSVDAHSTRALENVSFGVGIARRGGLTKREVLNARSAAAFAKAVRP